MKKERIKLTDKKIAQKVLNELEKGNYDNESCPNHFRTDWEEDHNNYCLVFCHKYFPASTKYKKFFVNKGCPCHKYSKQYLINKLQEIINREEK